MYKPKLKDWPYSHVKLLHLVVSGLALSLLVLWFMVYPSLRRLNAMRQDIEASRRELEKNGVQLDADVLSGHISDCMASLSGNEIRPGLVGIADNAMKLARDSFADEINALYENEPASDYDALVRLFVEGSTRIDYKDLYDRVSSEFANNNVDISQATISPDEDSNEPVYQQMLKLWTMRCLVRLAVENGLSFDNVDEKGGAGVRAYRSIAYVNEGSDRVYLLELPVLMRMKGKMDSFIAFVKALQESKHFLPMKSIEIYSEPPKDFPPGEKRELSDLRMRIVCSAFFVEPQPIPVEQNKADSK